jgi:hypothetical protein
MRSSTNTARLAGLLWLLTAVTGGVGLFTIRSRVIVPGDAAATAGNMMASEALYRAAIVGTLVSQVFLFFLGLTLFRLFREVDKRLATVLLASVMMTVGLAVINTLNHFEDDVGVADDDEHRRGDAAHRVIRDVLEGSHALDSLVEEGPALDPVSGNGHDVANPNTKRKDRIPVTLFARAPRALAGAGRRIASSGTIMLPLAYREEIPYTPLGNRYE